jgi:4-amino-4-deoxy-L-arabinose transferase-like glycosyltransferase
MMYRLGARLFSEGAGVYAALLLNVSAVFSLSTGSWILPDGPLMFFMMAATLVLEQLFFPPQEKPSWGLWVAAGLLIGLGMLAKYHAIFLAVGSFIFMITSKKRRNMLLTFRPYIALVIVCIVFLPVVIWNQEHNWISFLFQGARGTAKGFFLSKMLGNIAGQAAWVLPWIWGPLVWIFLKGLLGGPGQSGQSLQDRKWFLCCLAAGPIAVFTIATLWGAQGLFHWQAPGYLLALPLLGQATTVWLRNDRKMTCWWLRVSVTTFVVIVMIVGSHTATGWLKTLQPTWFAQGDPTVEALDWSDLLLYLDEKGLLHSQAKFVAAPHWIDAGKIDYILGGKIPVLCLSDEPHHFAFMHKTADFKGEDALIIGRQDEMVDGINRYRPYFTTIDVVGTVQIKRAGIPEFAVVVFYASGFNGTFPLPYGQ